MWLDSKADGRRITCSSDGAGCMPVFDEHGGLLSMDTGQVSVLLQTLKALIERGYAMERVLPVFTSNVADVLRMPRKGRIGLNSDADLVAIRPDGDIRYVMSRGQWMVMDAMPTRRGLFESRLKG